MRFIFATALSAGIVAALGSPVAAQVHGALSEAHVVPVNGRLGGAYVQFDRSSATLSGQLRLSFYPNLDFGFQGGLSRMTLIGATRTSVRLGADFRGQVATQGPAFPVTVALGGSIGVESADNFTILSVGPQVVFSRKLDTAGNLIGYGGASLLLSRYDVAGVRDTDTSFPVRAGLEIHASPDLRLLAEAQLAVSDAVRRVASVTIGALFPF